IGGGSGKLAQARDLVARALTILRREEGRRSKLQGKGAIVAKRDVRSVGRLDCRRPPATTSALRRARSGRACKGTRAPSRTRDLLRAAAAATAPLLFSSAAAWRRSDRSSSPRRIGENSARRWARGQWQSRYRRAAPRASRPQVPRGAACWAAAGRTARLAPSAAAA